MAVGIVRTIEVDGKLYVDAEDYKSLLKRYEDAVGTKTNEQIIAELGEDEIPDSIPRFDRCKSCRNYNLEIDGFGALCQRCKNFYLDHYQAK